MKSIYKSILLAFISLTISSVAMAETIAIYPSNYPGVKFSGDGCRVDGRDGVVVSGTPQVSGYPGQVGCSVVLNGIVIVHNSSTSVYEQFEDGLWCEQQDKYSDSETRLCTTQEPVCQ